jgi:hypothetical protein
MTRRYNYKVFPTTGKARVLLGLGFALGGVIFVGYIAFWILLSTVGFFPEPTCPAGDPRDTDCLDAQLNIRPSENRDCAGEERRVCLAPIERCRPH